MVSILARTRYILIALVLALSVTAGIWQSQSPANAQTATEEKIKDEIEAISNQLQQAQISLEGIQDERYTLEQTLDNLRGQISQLKSEIDSTKENIAILEDEIIKTQAEIDRQKDILAATFKKLYQQSGASALELLLASDSFSEYFDSQEYLERLKNGISESVEEIQALKEKLEVEETKQQSLLSRQQGQEISLVSAENEQQRLLRETQGRESVFQAQVDTLSAQQAEKEAELEAYIASLISSAVSLGPVAAGATIGKMGNTGWSSGPHLHTEVRQNTYTKLNPLSAINSNGWAWPVGGGGGWVSQGFHGGHGGTDIAGTEGTPIRAMASGNIIHRGCLYLGSNYATFGVIIDHGGGLTSLYIHMQAPNNAKYSGCSINRLPGGYYYGQPSIDYGTTF